jgi:hypothetical protein
MGVNTGRHVRYQQERKISELFISMLQLTGVDAQTFGDGDRTLDGLT